MGKISPSILAADFSKLGDEIKALEDAGADYIHIDVMDGHFVPNITIGPFVVQAVKKITKLPLDVHLMISDPDRYIDDFIKAGSDILTVHVEAATHLHRTISYIKERKIKAGVSLNPATSISTLDNIYEYVDMILVMSVNPGFGGQKFIEGSLKKVAEISKIIKDNKYNIELNVDGGIIADNIAMVAKAGADVFVSGSGVLHTQDYKATIKLMKQRIAEVGK